MHLPLVPTDAPVFSPPGLVTFNQPVLARTRLRRHIIEARERRASIGPLEDYAPHAVYNRRPPWAVDRAVAGATVVGGPEGPS
jgi:hypothetical protein